MLARAFDREPDLPGLIQRVICVGGAWHEPGNASAVAEFHFYCDPHSARKVLQSRIPLTLLPLDVTRKALFSPGELMEMTVADTRCCRFLKQITPFGIHMTSNLYGIEGFHLKDVLGVAALTMPNLFETRPLHVDVEIAGELTRGMSVVDVRRGQDRRQRRCRGKPRSGPIARVFEIDIWHFDLRKPAHFVLFFLLEKSRVCRFLGNAFCQGR